jgi:hypothetical protein
MIELHHISSVEIEYLIWLVFFFFSLLVYFIVYYMKLPSEIKAIKGFILGQLGGMIAFLMVFLAMIIKILLQISLFIPVLTFILFSISLSGVAYGNQILLKNKNKIYLSKEELDKRKEFIPWQYGGSIVLSIYFLFVLGLLWFM